METFGKTIALTAAAIGLTCLIATLAACQAPTDGVQGGPAMLEDSIGGSEAEGAGGSSGKDGVESPAGTGDDMRPFIVVEPASVPDMWLVEKFDDLQDWQRRLFVNSTDAETYRLLVDRYGEEEVGRYLDDDVE